MQIEFYNHSNLNLSFHFSSKSTPNDGFTLPNTVLDGYNTIDLDVNENTKIIDISYHEDIKTNQVAMLFFDTKMVGVKYVDRTSREIKTVLLDSSKINVQCQPLECEQFFIITLIKNEFNKIAINILDGENLDEETQCKCNKTDEPF
ncbi:MAG: hypothetical protein P0S94_00215 [Simkaniaceae bacterium]|nr:hypothetical protein [Simkaniaceae bacterium]